MNYIHVPGWFHRLVLCLVLIRVSLQCLLFRSTAVVSTGFLSVSLFLIALRPSLITSFRFHLGLNRVHWWEPNAHVSWAYVCCVNKVGWFSDHWTVYPPPPLRLGLLSNAAAETHPELSHADGSFLSLLFLSFSLSSALCLPVHFTADATNSRRKQITDRHTLTAGVSVTHTDTHHSPQGLSNTPLLANFPKLQTKKYLPALPWRNAFWDMVFNETILHKSRLIQ